MMVAFGSNQSTSDNPFYSVWVLTFQVQFHQHWHESRWRRRVLNMINFGPFISREKMSELNRFKYWGQLLVQAGYLILHYKNCLCECKCKCDPPVHLLFFVRQFWEMTKMIRLNWFHLTICKYIYINSWWLAFGQGRLRISKRKSRVTTTNRIVP